MSYAKQRPPFLLNVVILCISLPLILPFLYVILRTSDVGLARSIELLWRPRIGILLTITLLLTVVVTFLSIIIGAAYAFLLERYRIWGKPIFQVFATLPLCIPAFVSSFTWISLTFRVEGFLGAIMIMTLSSFPLAYLPIAASLRRIDYALEEVSTSLGRSRYYTFFHAIFPQLKPAIGNSLLLIALHMLIEFGAIAIINYQTFTTAIFQEYEMAFNNSTAALLSLVLMIICLTIVFAEMRLRGNNKIARSGKGVIRPYPVKNLPLFWHILTLIFFTTIFILGIGIPISMLFYWLKVGTSLHLGLDSGGR